MPNPLDPEIQKAMQLLVRRGRNMMLEIEAQTEASIIKSYQQAAARIGSKVSGLGSSAELFGAVYIGNEIQKEVVRLNQIVTKKISDSVEMVVGQSINDQIAAGRYLFGTALKGYDLTLLAPDSPMFTSMNFEAINAMRTSVDGVELSARIWELNRIQLLSMKTYLADAMLEGKSAAEISQEIRAFMHLPAVDMRTKKWRAFFKQNPPGRGVYKSAAKNAQRVLRTELHRAYRNAAVQYVKQMPWAEGMQWMLSDAHPEMDICDDLASSDVGYGPGVYTPDAFPDIPHAQCICFWVAVPFKSWLETPTAVVV